MKLPNDVDETRLGDTVARRLLAASHDNMCREPWKHWQGSDPYYIAYILYITHGEIDIVPYLDEDIEEVHRRQEEKLL